MESERFQTLKKYLNYDLPLDTSNPRDVTPEQAPRSLLFVQAGQERVLINKVYTGLDGVGRPGAFFSHLLTDLPPVSLPHSDKQLPFSAREAIELWKSNFWKESEQGSDPLELRPVSNEELATGSLSARNAVEVTEALLYVIQTFLMLGDQKRLYIAAPPDTVATLIWGLTHVLPHTLQIMRSLTFSTYERDLEEKILFMYGKPTAEKTLPIIIGTSWLSPSTHDLPSIYYQEQNPHGFALNCDLPDRKTPLIPDPLVSKFAQFAIRCFTSGNMHNLKALLDEAEKQNITDIASFLMLFTSFQEIMPKDDIIHFLKNFLTKMKTLLDKTMSALKGGKFLPEDEFWQWKSILSEIDTLKRENVRNSIIRLLTDEPAWWQEQGQDFILQLQNLANSCSDNKLNTLQATFIQISSITMQKQRGQIGEAIKKFNPFSSSSRENDPLALPTTFAEQVTNAIRTAQDELTTALQFLVIGFAEQVVQALSANSDSLTSIWCDRLATSIFPRIRINIWTYLLQRLSTMHYAPAYKRWWSEDGGKTIQEISTLAERDSGSQLDQACSSFIKHAAQELREAIKKDQAEALFFWQNVLTKTAPHTTKADIWLDLLQDLSQLIHIPAYQRWWQEQGKAAAHSLHSLADRAPDSKPAVKLFNYARNISNALYSAIADEPDKPESTRHIPLLLEILIAVTPTNNTDIWPDLLQKLSSTIHRRVDETYSWELQSLLLQTWAKIAVLKENQYLLRDWLIVRWSELHQLLALQLPDNWKRVGITKMLLATSDFTQIDEISLVIEQRLLFEEVLEQLLKAPPTQHTTLSFFALLAQHHYAHILSLLDRLLAACQYQKEVTEKLLASLHLPSSQEIADLLEHHCKVLLSEHELPPTLLNFLQQYLKDFDPDYLDSNPTRKLLWQLLMRKERPGLKLPLDLHKSCEGWYWIAEFIELADVENKERDWLDDLIYGAGMISQLTSDVRSKLAAKLIPRLVGFTSTEMDLVRMIDHLGRVLIEPNQKGISPKILLLEQMAKKAAGKYGQERPPVRTAPYIKVVLDECRFLPPAEKEKFVDRCLGALLKQVDTQTRDTFTSNPMLWPEHIVAEWKAYLSRSSRAALNEVRDRFESALKGREMFSIVAAYDPSLEGHLNSDEHEMLKLASKFVDAYEAEDDAALVNAYDAITRSPYRKLLGYTKPQKERIELARNRMLATSQPRSQPTAKASKKHILAIVKRQSITAEWFGQVLELKGPYTEYRISYLRHQIQILGQTNPTDHQHQTKEEKKLELRFRNIELKELEKLLGNPKQLRVATLDNLVNDVLIQEEIDKLIQLDQTNQEQFDLEDDLPGILDQLRLYHNNNYPILSSKDSSTLEKTWEILRIFRRHERFASYLYWKRSVLLQNWIREQRNHEKAKISVDYDLATSNSLKKSKLFEFFPINPNNFPGIFP